MIEILRNYWFLIITIPTLFGFVYTLMKLYANSQVLNKLQSNDIKHLETDIKTIKTEEKEFKDKITEELHQINLGIGRIERRVVTREAICNERHKNDSKK